MEQIYNSALIFFAHGSRNKDWAKPFIDLLAHAQKKAPQRLMALAFLELMSPNLMESIDDLVLKHAKKITVLPLFLGGQGKHLSADLTAIIATAKTKYPNIEYHISTNLGAWPALWEWIASESLKIP